MVKWATAFSREELTRSISAGKEEARKTIPILDQMSTAQIDEVLGESLQKNRPVSIQLNQKDSLGRQTESIVGYFRGYITGNKILISDQWVSPESIRNVHFLQEQKWSQVHVFTNKQKQVGGDNPIPVSSVNFDTEEQDPLETDLTWIEDFNQSEEWIE